jgi:hypothetical protein
MSSRLGVDPHGRAVVVVTTPSLWLDVGERFLVVDVFELGFTRPGRAPTPREMMSARPPYESKTRAATWERRAEQDDEQLAEAEAIRLAMLEQRRTPPDLVNVAA